MAPRPDLRPPIRPTLYLGLGGTGKEVLLRLRRKFHERLGVVSPPCAAYLWLDTDMRDTLAWGERMDEASRAVAFQPHEAVPLLRGPVKEDLRRIFADPEHWRHIHSWLPPEVGRLATEINDPPGPVRAIGRLTYFLRFAEIDAALREAVDSVRRHDVHIRTKEFFQARRLPPVDVLDDATEVVMVGSLAGGTGSGIFLDAAFHLKHVRGSAIHRTIGMFFMPNVFFENASGALERRIYGNAYAALQELEFHNLRLPDAGGNIGSDFQVEWEPGKAVCVPGPPFSVAYIVESGNAAGLRVAPARRKDAFEAAAESLFLAFMPGPSAYMRADYSGVAHALSAVAGANLALGDTVPPRFFARRYASFGTSRLEIPVDRIRAACAARLAHEIAACAVRDSQGPRAGDGVAADMVRLGLDASGIARQFGRKWTDEIHSAVDAVIPMRRLAAVDAVDDLERRIKEAEARLLTHEGGDAERWGTAVQSVRTQTRAVTHRVSQALRGWVRDTLEAVALGLTAPSRGAENPAGHLGGMLEELRGLYAPSRLGAPAVLDLQIAEAARDACDWANRRDSVLREIRTTLQSGRASLGLLLLGRAEWVGLALLRRLRDAEERYCIATVELCIFECAKEVAQAAAEGLARLRGSLGDLRVQEHLSEALTAISQEFLKASEDYLQFDEDALSTQMFFDRARDWPMFYRLDCDGQGQPMEVDPQAEHHKFLTPEFPEANVWNGAELNIRALFNGDGERELRSRLRVYAENRFWEDFESCPRPADVLSHPRMSANWQAAIERLVLSSTPLARRCKSLGGRVNPAFSYAYLAVPEPPRESVHVAAFVEEVGKRLEALTELRRGDITVLHTGKPYEVFLYVVAYAFPLAALPVTRDCHDAYHSFYRDGARDASGMAHSVPLHIDSRWEGKFEDLLVYDQATA